MLILWNLFYDFDISEPSNLTTMVAVISMKGIVLYACYYHTPETTSLLGIGHLDKAAAMENGCHFLLKFSTVMF